MYRLYYHSACVFSRKIRVLLNEIKAKYVLHEINFWMKNESLAGLNPAETIPILIDENNNIFYGNNCLNEYFMEKYSVFSLQQYNIIEKATLRRTIDLFENNFFIEVTKPILEEKILKFLNTNYLEPNSKKIRQAIISLQKYISYLEYLLKDNYYIFDDRLTFVDIVVATQISLLDYVNSFNWEKSLKIKIWYSLLKSRTSFQEILRDKIANLMPPRHYNNPDF